MNKDSLLAARGIGIIAVVVGHIEATTFPWANVYYWHIPLFFFIVGAGMLQERTWAQTARHVLVDTLLYLIVWTGLYIAMIYAMWPMFSQTNYMFAGEHPIRLMTTGIVEFNSHAVGFLAPCWFLLAYAAATVICTPLGRVLPRGWLAPAGIVLLTLGWLVARPEGFPLGQWAPVLLGQGLVGSGFCLLGAAFFASPAAQRVLLHPTSTLAALATASVVLGVWHPNPVGMAFMSLDPNALSSWVIALSGIQIAMFAAVRLSSWAWLRGVGRQSKSIMTHHLLGFGIISAVVVLLGGLSLSDLSAYTVYSPHLYWPVYIVAGLLVPLGISKVQGSLMTSLRT